MIDQFVRVLGIAHASQSEILSIILFVSLCSLALGWMTDGVMGDAGFGAFGNGLLTMLSGLVGMIAFSWAVSVYYGRYLNSNELILVIGLASIFSVTALLALALVKKHVT